MGPLEHQIEFPRPQYHTPGASTGVSAETARPVFSSSDEEEEKKPKDDLDDEVNSSDLDPNSSDLDTDFEADDLLKNLKQIQRLEPMLTTH